MIICYSYNISKKKLPEFRQVGDSLVCNGTNIQITQAPACNEFGYNEYLAIMIIFFSEKRTFLIDINVNNVLLQQVHLQPPDCYELKFSQ